MAGCLILILATPTAVLLLLLLLPSIMALAADQARGRPVAVAVLLFGLAASCHPLDTLWRAGHHMEDAWTLGTDISILAVSWSAQAGGWLLTQILPLVIAAFVEAEVRLRVGRLERRRALLTEEWSEEIK